MHRLRIPIAAGAVLLAATLVRATPAAENDAPAKEPAGEGLRVMTLNIRYNNPGDGANAWPKRKDMVADVIKRQRPDIFGLQEALKGQIDDLEKRLPQFTRLGVGRDDGKTKGEFSPLFYRKDRFVAEKSSTFWLSETPEKIASKSWDAAITRVATWAKLKDKKTGRTLLAINTHFDHRGSTARVNSAKLILAQIVKLAGKGPVVLTGDFNASPSSQPYRVITQGDEAAKADARYKLLDAKGISKSPHQGPDSTWNGFRAIVKGRRIDYIFVSRGVRVRSHAILAEKVNGRFVSDHLPVVAELVVQ